MRLQDKKKILAYLQAHDDGSAEAAEVITSMKNFACYADTESHSVCADDLDMLDGCETGDLLREKLGKSPGEPYTGEDCQRVADAMDECMCDEFSETLHTAINYQL